MPDETVLRTMLFDFYGELLTEKQREYFDLHYNADLSLAEIAESTGISRQTHFTCKGCELIGIQREQILVVCQL